MLTRAAVALEAGKPMEVMEVNLEGPKAGEVLVEIKATGHLPHRRVHPVRRRSGRGFSLRSSAMRARASWSSVGPGVTSLEVGDHVIPLYTPECRECDYCLNPKTNLCQAIRATQGQGLMPDGTSRFSMTDGTPILHYMGCSTFSNHTVLPEIALAKVRKDAPFDKICYIGCGVTTGIGAVINTAKVEIGLANCVVFGLGGIGLNVIQGLRLAGADMIVGVDLNPGKAEMAEHFGMTHFVNPKESRGRRSGRPSRRPDQGRRRGLHLRRDRQREVMRQALECAHKGWGESVIIGVAPAGAEIATRPFQLVTGRVWRGTAFGGASGRTDVPKIVDWYMDGKIEIDPMITTSGCSPDRGRTRRYQASDTFLTARSISGSTCSTSYGDARRICTCDGACICIGDILWNSAGDTHSRRACSSGANAPDFVTDRDGRVCSILRSPCQGLPMQPAP